VVCILTISYNRLCFASKNIKYRVPWYIVI